MTELCAQQVTLVAGGTDLGEAGGGFAAIGGGLILLAFPAAGVVAIGGGLLLYALSK